MDVIEELQDYLREYRQQILIVGAGLVLLFVLREKVVTSANRLIFIYFFLALAFRVDGRVPVGGALVLLVGSAVALVSEGEELANRLAIYAYYFLAIGVGIMLVEYGREGAAGEGIPEEAPGEKARQEEVPIAGECNRPRYIAIASGKGGVGKTTIAANLGAALLNLGNRVTLFDLDLAMPNLEIITGLKSTPVGMKDVLKGTIKLEQASYRVHGNLKVIPPGLMLEGYTEENKKKIRKMLGEFGSNTDYVILDMPPGREAVEVLPGGCGSLLVVNPDKASVLDAVNMKAVLEKRGIEVLGAILNRAGSDEEWIEEIENALEVKVVGAIPESKVVYDTFENEEFFVETSPGSRPSREITELAEDLDRK